MKKMNWKWTLPLAVALVGAALLLGSLASAKAPPPPPPPPPPIQYRITWLDATGAGNYIDMNDSGDIVGNYRGSDNRMRAFLYTSQTGLIDVASLVAPDDPSYGIRCRFAQGINKWGQIVGDGYLPGGVLVDYRFTPVGFYDDHGNWVAPGVELLPPPPGCNYFLPWRINDHGEVVATGDRNDGTSRVFVYDNTPSWIDTGASPLGSGDFLDFNNHAQVVGSHWTGSGTSAFRWSPDGTAQGKLELFSDHSWANGINDGGQFVGGVVVGDTRRAFRYTDGEGMKTLGTLGERNEAWGINDLAHVVGFYDVSARQKGTVSWRRYGFLHTDAFGMVPLDNLVTGSAEDVAKWLSAVYIEPRRISTPRLPDGTPDPNGFGQICGTAWFKDATGGYTISDAFLLTPEPRRN